MGNQDQAHVTEQCVSQITAHIRPLPQDGEYANRQADITHALALQLYYRRSSQDVHI